MEDLWRLVIREDYSALGTPIVDANNFELKPCKTREKSNFS